METLSQVTYQYRNQNKEISREWIIQNLLPKGELAILYAPQDMFKTFVAIRLAMEVATGSRNLGKSQIGTIYYMARDNSPTEFLPRVHALQQKIFPDKEQLIGENFNISFRDWSDLDLTSKIASKDGKEVWKDELNDWIQLDETWGQYAEDITTFCTNDYELNLIIIDTLSKSIGDSGINDDQAMRRMFNNLHTIADITKATILVVAHSGKDLRQGIMGSSIQLNDVPTVLEIKKNRGQMSLYVRKSKSSAKGTHIPFKEREAVWEGNETLYIDFGKEVTRMEELILNTVTQEPQTRKSVANIVFQSIKNDFKDRNSFGNSFRRYCKSLIKAGFLDGSEYDKGFLVKSINHGNNEI